MEFLRIERGSLFEVCKNWNFKKFQNSKSNDEMLIFDVFFSIEFFEFWDRVFSGFLQNVYSKIQNALFRCLKKEDFSRVWSGFYVLGYEIFHFGSWGDFWRVLDWIWIRIDSTTNPRLWTELIQKMNKNKLRVFDQNWFESFEQKFRQ